MRKKLAATALLAWATTLGAQQIALPAAPSTQPTTAASQQARYVLTLPPNCELVEVAGRKAICASADKAIVQQALRSVAPTTRPTTMPADLLGRLRAQRADLVKHVSDDFAMGDPKALEAPLDKLAADLERIEAFRPPIFYFCMSKEELKSMLKEGRWTTPAAYYNRLMDDVLFRQTVPLTLDRPMDDTLLIALRDKGDDDAAYQTKIVKLVSSTDAEMTRMVSGAAMYMVQSTIADVIAEQVFGSMKLPSDQQWLNVGMSRAMSADYSQDVIGSPRNELLLLIAANFEKNPPIKIRSIDLLHPANRNDLKRQYIVAYADAYQRKCVLVSLKILEKGRTKLPDLMKSLREKPCASGDELVKRIREATGVDVSKDVGPQ